jgi:signal peptidase
MAASNINKNKTNYNVWIAIIAIAIPLFIFLILSWFALGPVFTAAIFNQDHFILGVGSGTSMLFTVYPGDYLVIDTTPESIDIGDIIVYVYDGQFIGHRVIGITDDGYILKGDNNANPDPILVTQNMIIGEVEHIIKADLLKRIAEIWFERYY